MKKCNDWLKANRRQCEVLVEQALLPSAAAWRSKTHILGGMPQLAWQRSKITQLASWAAASRLPRRAMKTSAAKSGWKAKPAENGGGEAKKASRRKPAAISGSWQPGFITDFEAKIIIVAVETLKSWKAVMSKPRPKKSKSGEGEEEKAKISEKKWKWRGKYVTKCEETCRLAVNIEEEKWYNIWRRLKMANQYVQLVSEKRKLKAAENNQKRKLKWPKIEAS